MKALTFSQNLTRLTPVSTYKFSKLISIHFLKELVERFDDRSGHFLSGDHFINSHNVSLDNVWILLGENWSWSLLGLKGLIRTLLNADNGHFFLAQSTDSRGKSTSLMQTLDYQLCAVIDLSFLKVKRPSVDRTVDIGRNGRTFTHVSELLRRTNQAWMRQVLYCSAGNGVTSATVHRTHKHRIQRIALVLPLFIYRVT